MPDAQSRTPIKRARSFVIGLIGFLLIGAVIIFVLRIFQASALAEATGIHAKQYVTTIAPSMGGGAGLPLTLPGTLQGANEATVYARSTGYLSRWVKDIGSSVKKGEVLAEIAAPEVDQELSQAVATEQQAASSESLAQRTAERWKSLRDKDAVTQQDFDERESSYRQAQSNLLAAKANVARLRNLQGFAKVVAPFDGVITSRTTDVGDLVDAGNGGAGKALFTIAQVDPLRLYVYVPQAYAPAVKVGDAVKISVAGHLEDQYEGSIARTARAIDAATRTMQVEIRVPNSQGALIAGSYVQALLPIKQDGSALILPTNALLFRPDGPRVAIVDERGNVRLSPVKLGTDFGSTVAILSGVNSHDRVVVNPPDSLNDGDVVTLSADNAK